MTMLNDKNAGEKWHFQMMFHVKNENSVKSQPTEFDYIMTSIAVLTFAIRNGSG